MKVKDLKKILANCNDENEVEFFRYEYDESGAECFDEELVFDTTFYGLGTTRIIFQSELV
jgi:hypothetical protein